MTGDVLADEPRTGTATSSQHRPLRAVASTRRWSADEVLDLTAGVLRHLAELHDAGQVHGRVSRDHVVVDADTPAEVRELVPATAPADDPARTRDGDTLAPEVWAGGPATARSDLFAVGMLARNLVPAGDQRVWCAAAEVDGARFDRLLQHLTAVDPAHRPSDAGAALLLVTAADDRPSDETDRVRRRWVLSGAAVMVAVGLPWGAVMLQQPADDPSPALPPVERLTDDPAGTIDNLTAWLDDAAGR